MTQGEPKRPLLAAASITKSFSGVRALRNVSFDLYPGEVHAIVGENGAGKSTLVKVMTGAVVPDSGTLSIEGAAVPHMDPAAARRWGIAAIYQQPTLFAHLTVAENIGFSVEDPGAWTQIDWRSRRQQATRILERLGASIDPDREISTLSMPEQQLVEIAKALGAQARIVIMDEPTASLTEREVDRLLEVVHRLRVEGVGVIYISHRLAEVSVLADRVTVLRDGTTVTTVARDQFTTGDLIRLMVGRELATVFPKRNVPIGRVAIEVQGLSSRAAGIRDVSFFVRRGEVLGVAGLVGAGRTQLAETMFGVTPADQGTIIIDGRAVSIESPAAAIAAGIAYVPEDRRQHGVILEMAIAANTTLASLGVVSRYGLLDRAREAAHTREYVERFRIKTDSVWTETGTLSGGNQQKVALARWLSVNPRILILDEPTQGIDVGAKAEIHALMQDLAERGLAIMMISSELPEILAVSDRIVVMREGRIARILDAVDATPDGVMALALGHDSSPALCPS